MKKESLHNLNILKIINNKKKNRNEYIKNI